ncbi:MAG TPA: MerR family transcriptional regulator [Longimicrobiaceae bacterium]
MRRRRAFYSIGEVCEMLDLKPHVLRYWETQFPELSPTKNRAGNRVYQARELELIALIRKLVYEERYTLEGARRRVEELKAEGTAQEQSSRALERTFLRTLRQEMQAIEALLDPAGVDRRPGRE